MQSQVGALDGMLTEHGEWDTNTKMDAPCICLLQSLSCV